MKNILLYIFFVITFTVFTHFLINKQNFKKNKITQQSLEFTNTEESEGKTEEKEKYFNLLLRDPSTHKIPDNIRKRELEFAKKQEQNTKSMRKISSINELQWKEAGPNDVGGRTRALAIDVSNSSVILAGGASGGIWKSTNKGVSWEWKSDPSQNLSVTSIAQDKRAGHTNTWYYSGGEWSGSAQDLGFRAFFTGGGIFKSTDNGETWVLLNNTKDTNPASWNTPFDYVSKIVVNTASGSVFIASHGFGILKSGDGGNTFALSLGGQGEHIYADIDAAKDGTLVAVLSSSFPGGTSSNAPGVYKSTNDGQTWTSITPNTFPAESQRSVVAIAPSNTNTCYVMTYTGSQIDQKYDDIRFHKINIANGSSVDRSANMPNFNQDFNDFISTQGSYNMVVAVKPDDENFVLLAGTCLFRSTNGFSTKPNNMKLDWIGGYNITYFGYPNFHSDIHSFAFDPTNPKAMWWGNDGGLTYTSDITNTNYTEVFPWEEKNNGYNVTQFYMITQSQQANDNRIMGGAQDNGSPFFRFDGTSTTASEDISSGDGSYGYLGSSYCYASAQNGALLQVNYDGSGNPSRNNGWSNITPQNATNQSFINPFAIDPSDENILIYPAGNTIWRNNQLNSLPNNPDFGTGITKGWTQLTNVKIPSGYIISTLTISQNAPQHLLYFGISNASQTPQIPKFYKLANANTSNSSAVELNIPGLVADSYIHNIAVNPANGNEILVILSNYNVVGIYYSANAGQTFSAVEGNLTGSETNPGPSIRAASIIPTSEGNLYLVATSTGVYSTSQLNGNSTSWFLEGSQQMGNLVVDYITARQSDGRIVAGTHGRGAFVTFVNTGSGGTAVASVDVSTLTLQSQPGQTGSTSFYLHNDGQASLNYDITVEGSFGKTLPKSGSSNLVLNKANLNSHEFDKYRSKERNKNFTYKNPDKAKQSSESIPFVPSNLSGSDILYNDDGNDGADDFFGYGDGQDIYVYNEFKVNGFNFSMDAFAVFLRTESQFSNLIYAGIYDKDFNLLSEGSLSLNLSNGGDWFEINLNPALEFTDGTKFYIEIGSTSFIPFPVGVDFDGQSTNQSFYFNWNTAAYENLNTINGFQNGAFLIRAIGTKSGGGNQNPVAVANLSKTQATVNENINFNASQSHDNDGSIAQYLWNFGDGSTSTQQIASHSYSQANTYTYSLLVTDNKGATDQTGGQIVVSSTSNNLVIANPASGTIAPGSSQLITLTLNAQTLQEGTYTGAVTISTNGGNFVIPINFLVPVEAYSNLPESFYLSQNYPNPFNPTTTIEYSIPNLRNESNKNVELKIFDMLGREVKILVNQKQNPGIYHVNFDASSLTSGIYVYRLNYDNFNETKKMVLLK